MARIAPLAFGIDSRTRGFDPRAHRHADRAAARATATTPASCSSIAPAASSIRRFSETRRRHPLALDRPAEDGIARERELLAPLRRAADQLIDTTDISTNDAPAGAARPIRGDAMPAPTLAVMSFGFARGVPRNADLVFDMRFLRNPHWDSELRPMTGLDADVAAYVAADPAYDGGDRRGSRSCSLLLLPRYAAEGKSYVTVAFGCTGGRHRSVHVAETIAATVAQSRFFAHDRASRSGPAMRTARTRRSDGCHRTRGQTRVNR